MTTVKEDSQTINEDSDFLEVDAQIPGQNYCCLSFISPEKILKKQELYIFNYFIKDFFKNNKIEEIRDFDESKILEKYQDFRYVNETKLSQKFHEENDNQTTVRGIKVRGVYDSYKEAQVRAKVLQRMDSNFNVFVGQVGYWLPWDPEPDTIKDQEYLESELNNLMQEYKNNQDQKDLFYNEQLQERKKNTRNQVDSDDSDDEIKETSDEITNIMEQEDPWLKNKNK